MKNNHADNFQGCPVCQCASCQCEIGQSNSTNQFNPDYGDDPDEMVHNKKEPPDITALEVAVREGKRYLAQLDAAKGENKKAKHHVEYYKGLSVEGIKEILKLQAQLDALRKALIQHRADLHAGSTRPCGTCKQSAEALGIVVPDQCARGYWDLKALKGKPE